MKKLMYVSDEEQLNEYERECKRISYKTFISRYTNGNLLLCNNIAEIDECLYDNVEVGSLYDEESDEYAEIYQYYLADFTEWELEELRNLYNDEVIICYSEKLGLYVVCVDHLGTSWDYVLTGIKYTTSWEEYTEWKRGVENEQNSN